MKQSIIGLILAGGESSRMGRDKALMPWYGDHTLLSWAVTRLRPICKHIHILSSNPAHEFEFPSTLRIADFLPGKGPMRGIRGGIYSGITEWYLVLAVDMPYVDEKTLKALADHAHHYDGDFDAVVFKDEHGYQPLCALYHKSSLRVFADGAKRKKYKMQDLLAQMKVKTLDPPKQYPYVFANWNTLEDVPVVKVKVKLFASFRDKLGISEVEKEATDTDSLRAWLEQELPEAAQLNYRIAINQDLIQRNQILNEGDEVALMPPFAGG